MTAAVYSAFKSVFIGVVLIMVAVVVGGNAAVGVEDDLIEV